MQRVVKVYFLFILASPLLLTFPRAKSLLQMCILITACEIANINRSMPRLLIYLSTYSTYNTSVIQVLRNDLHVFQHYSRIATLTCILLSRDALLFAPMCNLNKLLITYLLRVSLHCIALNEKGLLCTVLMQYRIFRY